MSVSTIPQKNPTLNQQLKSQWKCTANLVHTFSIGGVGKGNVPGVIVRGIIDRFLVGEEEPLLSNQHVGSVQHLDVHLTDWFVRYKSTFISIYRCCNTKQLSISRSIVPVSVSCVSMLTSGSTEKGCKIIKLLKQLNFLIRMLLISKSSYIATVQPAPGWTNPTKHIRKGTIAEF